MDGGSTGPSARGSRDQRASQRIGRGMTSSSGPARQSSLRSTSVTTSYDTVTLTNRPWTIRPRSRTCS
jgi:hypothetical protein